MKTCPICLEECEQVFVACSNDNDGLCESCWEKIIPLNKRGLLLTKQIRCENCQQSIDYEKLPEQIRKQVESLRSTIPKTRDPQTIEDFNYHYNDKGELRHCETDEKFIFLTQTHYNRLGNCVDKYIMNQLKTSPWNYREIWLPLNDTDTDDDHSKQVNIFTSEDFQTNENGCLVLIQGSGVVRPGQWARSCCINESLDIGAMFPYMKKAVEQNLSVIILNPNQTGYVENDSVLIRLDSMEPENADDYYLSLSPLPRPKMTKIQGLSTNREHVLYVYDEIISKQCPAKKFFFVAHSAGGDCLMYLLRKREQQLLSHFLQIAFTDSVHSILPCESNEIIKCLKTQAKHFVASEQPMDEPIASDYNFSGQPICPEVSAGHPKHEYTSGYCVDGVFKFFFPTQSDIMSTKL